LPSDHLCFTFMSHYYYYLHHHHFSSRFHRWVRTCDIWLFELGLSHSAWWSPVPSIFQQVTEFHFSLWLSNSLIYYLSI
jgi:hypothetical protein